MNPRSDSLSDLCPIVIDSVWLLPVLHERLEYADLVRETMDRLKPDAVAVEIPSSLERTWLQGVDRLPSVSVMLYENRRGRTIYLPIQPADPMAEAARTARARGLRIACADLDVDDYADYRDPVPDPYALLRLGLPAVYEAFRALPRRSDASDDRREASMAYHARRLREDGARRVLLICGMHHAEGVARQFEVVQAAPFTSPSRRNVRLVHLHPESLGEVLTEIPFHIAAWEARRNQRPEPPAPSAPTTAARHYGPFRVLSGGGGSSANERAMSAVTRAAIGAEVPSSREIAGTDAPGGRFARPGPLDRLRSQWTLLREAEHALVSIAPDEQVKRWQRVNLARYARNLAIGSGQLVPDLYDLLTAARGCVSDNFAWELHRLAIAYPAQAESATDLSTARIRADEMFEGTRRLRLQRRLRRPKRPDWRSILKRRRATERFPGEWLEGFDDDAICSYPPEDVIIEEFGHYLQKRGKSIVCEERSRTVPFTTSVLDGIDVRETIRHWTEKRIFVRELGRAPGGIGSVVVIFDADESRYPYAQTWLGEHEQESDLAFYSTDPTQGIVGPGICRVTYGGLMMSYPPRRMADVWTDADYRLAESRAEVMLLAALDYSTENTVVHVAPQPPRPVMSQIASSLGMKILHIPIGTLSPTTLKKISVMHILSGHGKRKIAKDYIW